MGYIKFKQKESCDVALHLTNTVFLDRALIVVEASDGEKCVYRDCFISGLDDMPADEIVINVAAPAAASANGVGNDGAGAGLLPTPSAVCLMCIIVFYPPALVVCLHDVYSSKFYYRIILTFALTNSNSYIINKHVIIAK